MNIPEIFKYSSIISAPLFSIVALLLIKRAPEFSFSKSTVSKSIFHLKGKTHRLIFRLNFILKSMLDFSFIYYLIYSLRFSVYSLLGWSLILSVLFFGLLAYFIEGRHSIIHKILVYSNGVFWAICQILLSQYTKDSVFILFTYISTAIAIILAFGSLFTKRTNVFVQAVCMLLLYFWLAIFVFRYL